MNKKVFGIIVGILILGFIGIACVGGLAVGGLMIWNRSDTASEVTIVEETERNVLDDVTQESSEIFTPADTATPQTETADEPKEETVPSGTAEGIKIDTANLETLFTPFWEAWEIVHEYYVDQPVDEQALIQGAIDGVAEAGGGERPQFEVITPAAFDTGVPAELDDDF